MLVTAAHVLAVCRTHNLYLSGKPLVELYHEVVTSSRLIPEVCENDLMDLCCLFLTSMEVQKVISAGFSFIEATNENITWEDEDLGSASFLIAGYPTMSVYFDHEAASISASRMIVDSLGGMPEKRIAKMKRRGIAFHAHFGIVMHFPGRVKIDGFPSKRPTRERLRGISGGGIWTYNPTDRFRLVGVVNRFMPSESLLVGSRIQPLLQHLKTKAVTS